MKRKKRGASRQERIDRYFAAYVKLPPEEKLIHQRILIEALLDLLKKPRPVGSRTQPAIVANPEQVDHADQDRIDSIAASLLAELDI